VSDERAKVVETFFDAWNHQDLTALLEDGHRLAP
jgi:hypothetical protein